MPRHLRPMLATPAKRPPGGEGWAAEIKWDGVRALTYISPKRGAGRGGLFEMESRLGNNLDQRFPEFAGLIDAVGGREMVLDGEIVAFDPEGRPRFGLLQKRLQRLAPRQLESDATYLIFDLLFLAGRSTMALPYSERRELLQDLSLTGPHWQTPPALAGDIAGLLEASRQRGIEGLVVKRQNSPYRPGLRSREWLKLKNVNRREFLIGGWLPGGGQRSGRIGSLLLGAWRRTDDGGEVEVEPRGDREPGERRLHYAGRVGTGFDQAWLDRLADELAPLRRSDSPFETPGDRALAPPPRSIFVEPRLVAEIEYAETTSDGMLRHSSFKGLRPDKPADDVVWEDI